MQSNHDYFMITYDYIIQIFRMISYDIAKILYSKKTNTKIGILGKITEARVMVCLFNPSKNMNWYVQGVYIE